MKMKTNGPKSPMSEDLTQAGTSNLGSLYPLHALPAARRVGLGCGREEKDNRRLAVGEWH